MGGLVGVGNLLGVVVTTPNTPSDSPGDANGESDRKGSNDQADEDLDPQPLLLGQATPGSREAEAVVPTPLILLSLGFGLEGLFRWPDGAFLDAGVDAVCLAWAVEGGETTVSRRCS